MGGSAAWIGSGRVEFSISDTLGDSRVREKVLLQEMYGRATSKIPN